MPSCFSGLVTPESSDIEYDNNEIQEIYNEDGQSLKFELKKNGKYVIRDKNQIFEVPMDEPVLCFSRDLTKRYIMQLKKIMDEKAIFSKLGAFETDKKNIFLSDISKEGPKTKDLKIKQKIHDVIKMYLTALKNGFIVIDDNFHKRGIDNSEYFQNFNLFCYQINQILRDYIFNNPDCALLLIEEYIDQIPFLIRYIEPREAIAILEKKPELLLDKNRLNKFFADEKLMLNDSDVNNVYSILKDNDND